MVYTWSPLVCILLVVFLIPRLRSPILKAAYRHNSQYKEQRIKKTKTCSLFDTLLLVLGIVTRPITLIGRDISVIDSMIVII